MHQQYAKDGLVVISVSLDEAESRDRVVKFLNAQKATFQNFLLTEEEPTVWQKAFDIAGPPALMLYDRTGKKVKTLVDKDLDDDKVEAAIKDLLK